MTAAGAEQGHAAATAEIRWSEVRTYRAVIGTAELAGAVAAFGQDGPGHPLPADLTELEGDPFEHGDLAGLLCALESESLSSVGDIEVTKVVPCPPTSEGDAR